MDPLPHQIKAVYGELLPRTPLRFLLADDPGAGKTFMAGLYVKELMLRGNLARCLIVAPGNLVEQWQEELYDKFGLRFEVRRHLLLMTATPHAGKQEDFQLFLALLDGDRFEGRFRDGVHSVEPTDLMVKRRAVDSVLSAEHTLGRRPTEMPPNNPGYDIRSEARTGR